MPAGQAGGDTAFHVAVNFTLQSTVTSFDGAAQAEFKERLGALLGGVSASRIILTVMAASILVSVSVLMPNVSSADAAAATLTTASVADLSSSLGVVVESMSTPSVDPAVGINLMAPPPSSVQSSQDAGMILGVPTPLLVATICATVGLLVVAGCLAMRCYQRRLSGGRLAIKHRRNSKRGVRVATWRTLSLPDGKLARDIDVQLAAVSTTLDCTAECDGAHAIHVQAPDDIPQAPPTPELKALRI